MISKMEQSRRRRQLHTIISREIIKPSSPTPSHLQVHNLSQIDQCMIKEFYEPVILLYPNKENTSLSLTSGEKARVMKEALSKSLTRWYPLAGILHTPTTSYIDCNDEGVVFVEAKHDTQLDKFQHMIEVDESVLQLFADGMVWKNSADISIILGVQLNHFVCGGLAVAVSMSHSIGDFMSLCSFINYWASVAHYGSTDHKDVMPLNPYFIQSPATSIFVQPVEALSLKQRCPINRVTRKFVFPNSKLSDLKNKVLALAEGSTGSITLAIDNPTRFEVLTSLLYKTATNPISSSFKRSYLLSVMDVRKKFIPKLPQNTVGNVIACLLVTTSDTSLSVLVSEIRKQKMELERVQSLQLAYQSFERLANEDVENVTSRTFWCSSLCGFPLNKADFGWGKPVVTGLSLAFSNYTGFVLTDTPNGDGIEAWVTLETEDMEIFQKDKEMLLFCKN